MPSIGTTNPIGGDSFSGGALSKAQPIDSKPLKPALLENHKPLLASALLGGILLQVVTMLFFSEDLSNTQIDLAVSKTASVYFTSVDQLSNSESQVSLNIDGKEQGLTPLQLEIKPGKHEVELVQGEWRFPKFMNLKQEKRIGTHYLLRQSSSLSCLLSCPMMS